MSTPAPEFRSILSNNVFGIWLPLLIIFVVVCFVAAIWLDTGGPPLGRRSGDADQTNSPELDREASNRPVINLQRNELRFDPVSIYKTLDWLEGMAKDIRETEGNDIANKRAMQKTHETLMSLREREVTWTVTVDRVAEHSGRPERAAVTIRDLSKGGIVLRPQVVSLPIAEAESLRPGATIRVKGTLSSTGGYVVRPDANDPQCDYLFYIPMGIGSLAQER